MMVLTFECSAAFSTGGCFWSYFFSWKMDPTAVSAVGNKKQTHIGRADVVVISDFQFIFIAPLQNIIRNICSWKISPIIIFRISDFPIFSPTTFLGALSNLNPLDDQSRRVIKKLKKYNDLINHHSVRKAQRAWSQYNFLTALSP